MGKDQILLICPQCKTEKIVKVIVTCVNCIQQMETEDEIQHRHGVREEKNEV